MVDQVEAKLVDVSTGARITLGGEEYKTHPSTGDYTLLRPTKTSLDSRLEPGHTVVLVDPIYLLREWHE